MTREKEGLRRGEGGGENGPDGSEENVEGERIAQGAARGEDGEDPGRERKDARELANAREKRDEPSCSPGSERLADRSKECAAADAEEHPEDDRPRRGQDRERAWQRLQRGTQDEKEGKAEELDVCMELDVRRQDSSRGERHLPERPAARRDAEREGQDDRGDHECVERLAGLYRRGDHVFPVPGIGKKSSCEYDRRHPVRPPLTAL